MRRTGLFAGVFLAAVMALHTAHAGYFHEREPGRPRSKQTVRVVVATMKADDAIGKNAAAGFCLKLLSSFRRSIRDNSNRLVTFGSGELICGTEKEVPSDHAEAEALGKRYDAQLVIWGSIHRFDKDVVIQPFLSLVPTDSVQSEKHQVWRNGEVAAAPPRPYYALTTFVLTGELVERFRDPGALTLYKQPGRTEPIGAVGGTFRLLQSDFFWGDEVKVKTQGDRQGYLDLTGLASIQGNAVLFASAMIRYYRADWEGAFELFQRMLRSDVGGELRLDALLYSARCSLEFGSPSRAKQALKDAQVLNRFDPGVLKYTIMAEIATGVSKAQLKQTLANASWALQSQQEFLLSAQRRAQ